jgi:hypothetical protein
MVQQSRWSVRWSSDAFVLLLLQALLVVLVCIGVARGIGVQHISAGAGATLSGTLWLYSTYVAGTVACGFAIQVAEAGHGHKGFLVLVDYAMLTYLFVWCEWFRERIFALYPLASG